MNRGKSTLYPYLAGAASTRDLRLCPCARENISDFFSRQKASRRHGERVARHRVTLPRVSSRFARRDRRADAPRTLASTTPVSTTRLDRASNRTRDRFESIV